jgi:hypothetical protein
MPKSKTILAQGWGPLWEFYSPRLKRSVSGIGTLRLEHCILIECDPAVDSYAWLPTLDTLASGSGTRHTIDTLVSYRDGRKIAHTVAGSAVGMPDDKRFEMERSWAAAHGCEHRVLRKEHIRFGDRLLFNCFTLFPWLSDIHKPSDQETRSILGTLAVQTAPIEIALLAERASCEREITVSVVFRAYVAALVGIPEIRIKSLRYDTLVSRANI